MPPIYHSVLGASSAHRWLACTPSAMLAHHLSERFGTKTSAAAEEGTKAHELCELKLCRAVWELDGMTGKKLSALPKIERNAYPGINQYRFNSLRKQLGEIPEEMTQAADTYCDVVLSKLCAARAADPSAEIFIEQKLDYSHWVPDGFGTGDCIIISDAVIEVIDFKYGKGVLVDACGNPQLRLYALGAYSKFAPLCRIRNVRYTIVQPRMNNLSEETIPVEELLAWAEFEVKPKAELAHKGQGEYVTGEHCRWCPAKAICSKRVSEALQAFGYGFAQPGTLPDEMLPGILETLDVAESWIKDIRAYAEQKMLSGAPIHGWKLVHGKRPNRAWKSDEDVKAQLLRAGYTPEQFEQTKLKSVGEMEKLLGKTAFTALLSDLVAQGEGKPVLAPESDLRIAISSADAAFADMETTSTEKSN